MGRSKKEFDGKAKELGLRSIGITSLLVTMLVSMSCSSCAESTNSKAVNSRSKSNSAANSNERGSNTPNAETANLNGGSLPPANTNNRTAERIEKMRANSANAPVSPTAGVSSRPGPEDSVIFTELKDVARETRIFKKHPLLAKVEKTHDGKTIAVKVFLRDGRIIDVPAASVVYLDQMPASTILQVAGVPQTQTGQTDGQKPNPARKKEGN